MEIFVPLILWLLFGSISSYFANQRGRDPFAWFLIGIALGFLSLLLLFLLPPLEKKPEGEFEKKEEPALPVSDTGYWLKAWYYLDKDRNPVGPVTFNELKKADSVGKIQSDTLLWSEGMNEWKALKELPELQEAL